MPHAAILGRHVGRNGRGAGVGHVTAAHQALHAHRGCQRRGQRDEPGPATNGAEARLHRPRGRRVRAGLVTHGGRQARHR